MQMSMLKPIAPELFSLRDSSIGVTTQWRAASSAFQDMETMRDECVGNRMRRCNKIKWRSHLFSQVWNGKCRVWSVECKVGSVECRVWGEECKV